MERARKRERRDADHDTETLPLFNVFFRFVIIFLNTMRKAYKKNPTDSSFMDAGEKLKRVYLRSYPGKRGTIEAAYRAAERLMAEEWE